MGTDETGDEEVDAAAHGPARGDDGAAFGEVFDRPTVVGLGVFDGSIGPAIDCDERAGESIGEATSGASSTEPSTAGTAALFDAGADGGGGPFESEARTGAIAVGCDERLGVAETASTAVGDGETAVGTVGGVVIAVTIGASGVVTGCTIGATVWTTGCTIGCTVFVTV